MLRTRLWMGSLLIALTLGVLLLDGRLAPWYPFLLVLMLVLALGACAELLALLGPARRPWPVLCFTSVGLLVAVNWLPHLCPFARSISPDPLRWILGTYVAVILVGFLAAMRSFQPDSGDALGRLALLLLTAAYLGVLPGFLAQLRWPVSGRAGDANLQAVVSLALAIFVPKSCDIGAYFTGRLLGRHKMSPVLSPKKTLEGLAGGLIVAALAAVLINSLGPALPGDGWMAVGFGLTVGGAGVLGDLAESLIKRECRQKDASQVMPGFGGVLDVVDSILYAAPVAYCWLA